MPDIYLSIGEADPQFLDDLMASLERRAVTPQQAASLEAYLGDIEFPGACRVLDIGCGTGAQSRALACRPGVGEVVGVDQFEPFLERARALAADLPNLRFERSDAHTLPFGEGTFDVVVLHTVLTHVADPEQVVSEVFRVLEPGGTMAIYDGDFTTMSAALFDGDPLQACMEAFLDGNVNDRYLARRLRPLVVAAGFVPDETRSHGHLDTADPVLALGWLDKGVGYMVAAGRIDGLAGEALKSEARRRIAAGAFYGYMNYVSLLSRKPA
jgi:SAM-dependent methyltransferase